MGDVSHPQNRLTVYTSLGGPKKSGQYLASDRPLATATTLSASYPKLITAYGATAKASRFRIPSARPWHVSGESQAEEGSNTGLRDMYTLAASAVRKRARTRNERFLRNSERGSMGSGGVCGSCVAKKKEKKDMRVSSQLQ